MFCSKSFCSNTDEGGKKKWFLGRATVSVELAFSPHVCWVLSSDTPISSLRRWVGMSNWFKSENVWVCVSVSCDGRWVSCPGEWESCLAPWAAGKGSRHLQPQTRRSKLENNNLICFSSLSWMYVLLTFISVFNIRSVWGLYLEVQCCFMIRTLVYIN